MLLTDRDHSHPYPHRRLAPIEFESHDEAVRHSDRPGTPGPAERLGPGVVANGPAPTGIPTRMFHGPRNSRGGCAKGSGPVVRGVSGSATITA